MLKFHKRRVWALKNVMELELSESTKVELKEALKKQKTYIQGIAKMQSFHGWTPMPKKLSPIEKFALNLK